MKGILIESNWHCPLPRMCRSRKGAVTVEFAAAIALLLPVMLIIVFACYEVAMALMIYNTLNYSAHAAALALSKAYGSDGSYASSLSKQQQVFRGIRCANIVIDVRQFTAAFPPSPAMASWRTTGNVPAVVVTCTYQGGQYGLPPFPNPDPLNLSSQFTLQAQATAYLE